MNTGILIEGAVGVALSSVKSVIALFSSPPLVYFVAVALVGSIAGMAKIFVPMRKR